MEVQISVDKTSFETKGYGNASFSLPLSMAARFSGPVKSFQYK
jgi:hypothetical protein